MEKPRALIVGAGGFLGTYLVKAAQDRFEVVRGARSIGEPEGVAIDITDQSSVDRAFEIVEPHAVLLLAAISDIDRCEAQPEHAFAVNVRGAEVIANACARKNSRLLFSSTGAVFDGRKHGYREEDDVSPLSVYRKTKAEDESLVQALVPAAVIARLSLVLGFTGKKETNSMLDRLLFKWKAGESVSVPTFEFRNPIHAQSVSEIMATLIANPKISGIYHLGAYASLSRYQIPRRLAPRPAFPVRFLLPK